MIYILTVHWKTAKWIDIQLKYLNHYIDEDFKIYSFLNYLPDIHHNSKHFYCSTEPIKSHAEKLNLLACIVADHSADDNDILIFLDSDAFPINPLMPFVHEKLKQYPLIAVQRLENNGDIQPHPLFCCTTVGFWKTIKGDWSGGYTWSNLQGKLVTDVGGNLLKILQEKSIEWYPILKSNNYHSFMFAIYENLIYHHGAGSRKPCARVALSGRSTFFKNIDKVLVKIAKRRKLQKFQKFLIKLIPSTWPVRLKVIEETQIKSDKIYQQIKGDFFFYQDLI